MCLSDLINIEFLAYGAAGKDHRPSLHGMRPFHPTTVTVGPIPGWLRRRRHGDIRPVVIIYAADVTTYNL